MKRNRLVRRARFVAGALAAGTVFQLGGCDLGEVTVTQTLDGRDLFVTIFRSAILNPIDAYVTNAIDEMFAEE